MVGRPDSNSNANQRTSGERLNVQIAKCQECERLRSYCQTIGTVKRRAYRDWEYWARPVPNLGDFPAPLLIVGLAPGAHGANRTGRMFTGDRSGEWLFRAMHRANFCNQATWETREDGLRLLDCAITAVCHCAPPDNKPKPVEIQNCSGFLFESIKLCRPKVLLCLGRLAWSQVCMLMNQMGILTDSRPEFSHGAHVKLNSGQHLLASYHPSQQNTFTGRLTESMLDSVFGKARRLVDRPHSGNAET